MTTTITPAQDLTHDLYCSLDIEQQKVLNPAFFIAGCDWLSDYNPPSGAYVTGETVSVCLNHYLLTRMDMDAAFCEKLAGLKSRVIVTRSSLESRAVRAAIFDAERLLAQRNANVKGKIMAHFSAECVKRVVGIAEHLTAAQRKPAVLKVMRHGNKILLVAANGAHVSALRFSGEIKTLTVLSTLGIIPLHNIGGAAQTEGGLNVFFVDGKMRAVTTPASLCDSSASLALIAKVG